MGIRVSGRVSGKDERPSELGLDIVIVFARYADGGVWLRGSDGTPDIFVGPAENPYREGVPRWSCSCGSAMTTGLHPGLSSLVILGRSIRRHLMANHGRNGE